MIINPYRFVSGGAGSPGVYKANAFATDQSGLTATLAVPGSPVDGDYLLAILSCRGDRSFTVPLSWTILHDTGPASSSDHRYYILQKTYVAEASVSFTQSVSAAYGFQLVLISRAIGVSALVPGSGGATITKSNGASDLIACRFYNGYSDIASQSIQDAYTMRGTTSFFTSPNYFYVGMLGSKSGVPAGSASAMPSGVVGESPAMFLGEVGG